MIQNLVTKTFPKFIALHSFLKISKHNFENVIKINKILMDSEKSINLFLVISDIMKILR